MHLLLIRHGESVDNVAGLYAGSRDAPLTNHGVLQAKRLAAHLAGRRDAIGPVKHVFASNLQRAVLTAQTVVDAQRPTDSSAKDTDTAEGLEVVQLVELREKDFGSLEGQKFGIKAEASLASRSHSDVETREAMRARVDRFIANHLSPILIRDGKEGSTVVIVAHGIILNVLLQALFERYPSKTAPVLSSNESPRLGGEYSVSWSNTGVLQATIDVDDPEDAKGSLEKAKASEAGPSSASDAPSKSDPKSTKSLIFTVQSVNNVDHLNGLKKTRGGIGSSRFDARQRTMESFFTPPSKKAKREPLDH